MPPAPLQLKMEPGTRQSFIAYKEEKGGRRRYSAPFWGMLRLTPALPCLNRHRPEKGLRDAGVVQPMSPDSGLREGILQLSASTPVEGYCWTPQVRDLCMSVSSVVGHLPSGAKLGN